MKRVVLSALILTVISLMALATPQQRSVVPNQNKQVQFSADSMFLKEGNILHCKGNAEARIVPIHADENIVIIRADEVIYHQDTGEIETRGDAKVTMEKVK
jgi:lipopolysaccharide assembly outer membrane protein LptD (OstA)